MKFTHKVQVKNPMGLHTRPATWIVKELQNVKCEVHFMYKNMTINAKSILSILMLAVRKNSKITIVTEGEEAEETMKRLIIGFEQKFGE